MARLDPKTYFGKSGRKYQLRSPRLDEAAALLSYLQLSARESGDFYETSPQEFASFTIEQEMVFIRHHLETPTWFIATALDEAGVIVACLTFANGARSRSAHRGLLGLSVARAHHRDGLALALMNELLTWADASDVIEKIGLEVDPSNTPAIALYEKLGFRRESLLAKNLKHGSNDYRDTLAMGLWI